MPADPLETDLAAARANLELLVRRLRSMSPRARKDRAGAAHAAVDGLVALQAQLEGMPLDPPVVAEHILADALAVVGGDVIEAIASGRDRAALDVMEGIVSQALQATR